MSWFSKRRSTTHREANPVDQVDTPRWLANVMWSWARPYITGPILEPSVGNGALLSAIDSSKRPLFRIVGYELKPDPRIPLIRGQFQELYYETDFLLVKPPSDGFAVGVANPPFSELGAYEFAKRIVTQWLRPNGALITIVPWYAVDNLDTRVPFWDRHTYRIARLPRNTFRDSGCPNINSVLMLLKPEPRPAAQAVQFEFLYAPDNQIYLED